MTFSKPNGCCCYLLQDVKPGDIGNKRGMWETKKVSTPAKVTHTHL